MKGSSDDKTEQQELGDALRAHKRAYDELMRQGNELAQQAVRAVFESLRIASMRGPIAEKIAALETDPLKKALWDAEAKHMKGLADAEFVQSARYISNLVAQALVFPGTTEAVNRAAGVGNGQRSRTQQQADWVETCERLLVLAISPELIGYEAGPLADSAIKMYLGGLALAHPAAKQLSIDRTKEIAVECEATSRRNRQNPFHWFPARLAMECGAFDAREVGENKLKERFRKHADDAPGFRLTVRNRFLAQE